MYENKVAELIKKLEDEHSLAISLEKELNTVTQKLSNNERALMVKLWILLADNHPYSTLRLHFL